jgi:hypothetical protein
MKSSKPRLHNGCTGLSCVILGGEPAFPFIDKSTATLPNGVLCCRGYKTGRRERKLELQESPVPPPPSPHCLAWGRWPGLGDQLQLPEKSHFPKLPALCPLFLSPTPPNPRHCRSGSGQPALQATTSQHVTEACELGALGIFWQAQRRRGFEERGELEGGAGLQGGRGKHKSSSSIQESGIGPVHTQRSGLEPFQREHVGEGLTGSERPQGQVGLEWGQKASSADLGLIPTKALEFAILDVFFKQGFT